MQALSKVLPQTELYTDIARPQGEILRDLVRSQKREKW